MLTTILNIGIVRKVKTGYLLVSHTHNDCDADIGTTSFYLKDQAMQTPSRFGVECQNAWKDGSEVIHEMLVISTYLRLSIIYSC